MRGERCVSGREGEVNHAKDPSTVDLRHRLQVFIVAIRLTVPQLHVVHDNAQAYRRTTAMETYLKRATPHGVGQFLHELSSQINSHLSDIPLMCCLLRKIISSLQT